MSRALEQRVAYCKCLVIIRCITNERAAGGVGAQWPDFQRVPPWAPAGLGPGSPFLSQDPWQFARQWPRCLLLSNHPEQSSLGSAFAGFSIRDLPPRTEQESFKIIHEKLMAVLSAGGFAGRERLVGDVESREGKPFCPLSHPLYPPSPSSPPPRPTGPGSRRAAGAGGKS